MKHRKIFIVVIIILLAGLITACAPANQPSEIDTEPQPEPQISTDTPAPEDLKPEDPAGEGAGGQAEWEVPPPGENPAGGEISPTGPWIVYSGVAGLFAGNLDGTGFSMIHEFAVATPYVATVKLWPAPNGGRVAVLELIHFENGIHLKYPYLKVIKLPGGEVEFESWLIPQSWLGDGLVDVTHNMRGTRGYETQDGMRVEQVFAAAGVWNEIAWSSDGTMLAFNAAIHGQSTDLYLYDTLDGSLLRLTDGPSQSVLPVFSPDDEVIVHGAVETLNYEASGYGYDYLNVWAARSDGGGVKRVYNREFYGIETVIGWLSDTEYLVRSEEVFCGSYDVRLVDVNSGVRFDLAVGIHNYSALGAGKLLFSVSEYSGGEHCPDRLVETGVYLLDINSRSQLLLSELDANQIDSILWNEESGLFYVPTGDTFYTVDSEGDVTSYPTLDAGLFPENPLISPDGLHWFFLAEKEQKVAIGGLDGDYDEYIVTAPSNPVWSSDSTKVIFLDSGFEYFIVYAEVSDPKPDMLIQGVWSPNTDNPLMVVNP